MSKTSKPRGIAFDAMRAFNAPKVLGGASSASSQQINQPSTRANDDKPLFSLDVTQVKSAYSPTFAPGGVRRSKANMSGAFSDEAFAAPTSAPGKIPVELFGGPATP